MRYFFLFLLTETDCGILLTCTHSLMFIYCSMPGHVIADCWCTIGTTKIGTIAKRESNLIFGRTNKFSILQNMCENCNCLQCACKNDDFQTNVFEVEPVSSINTEPSKQSETNILHFEKRIGDCVNATMCNDSKHHLIPKKCIPILENHDLFVSDTPTSSANNIQDIYSFDLNGKGINIGHLNVQGICGDKMSKFSEITSLLTAPVNSGLHIFGMSETKLKEHKPNDVFKIVGFQLPFRKDNNTNGGGVIIVYVRDGILAKRREDLETHDIACLWIEICPNKGKSFLVGNIYRPPDSKIENNDRFEEFIDFVSNPE